MPHLQRLIRITLLLRALVRSASPNGWHGGGRPCASAPCTCAECFFFRPMFSTAGKSSAPCTCAECFLALGADFLCPNTSAPCTCAECFGKNYYKDHAHQHRIYEATHTNAQLHIKSQEDFAENSSCDLSICSFGHANPMGKTWFLQVRTGHGGDRPPTMSCVIILFCTAKRQDVSCSF